MHGMLLWMFTQKRRSRLMKSTKPDTESCIRTARLACKRWQQRGLKSNMRHDGTKWHAAPHAHMQKSTRAEVPMGCHSIQAGGMRGFVLEIPVAGFISHTDSSRKLLETIFLGCRLLGRQWLHEQLPIRFARRIEDSLRVPSFWGAWEAWAESRV